MPERDNLTPNRTNHLVGLEVSEPDSGDPTIVTVSAAGPEALGVLQGRINYDRSKARYLGQYVDANTVVTINDEEADRGTIRFMSLDAGGVPRKAARFAFDVLEPGFTAFLVYEHKMAVQVDETVLRSPYEQMPTNIMRQAPAELAYPRRMTLADWIEYRHPASANTLTPDPRPAISSPATTGFTLPPSGFFDVTATFVGAVAPQLTGSAQVPWYAGWTIGW